MNHGVFLNKYITLVWIEREREHKRYYYFLIIVPDVSSYPPFFPTARVL